MPRILEFGHVCNGPELLKWAIKTGNRINPHRNNWTDDPESVWVDTINYDLHLTIKRRGRWPFRRWYSTEVVCQTPLGYGTYEFKVATPIVELPATTVFAVFLYPPGKPVDNVGEIDIECGQMHVPTHNLTYTIQPYFVPRNFRVYNVSSPEPLTHRIYWRPDGIHFQTLTDTERIARWFYPHAVPNIGQRLHLNLWSLNGKGHDSHVAISEFRFTPMGGTG